MNLFDQIGAPALSICDRLSFAYKAVLGGLVVVILLALLAYLGFQSLSHSMTASEIEIAAMRDLRRNLLIWRDIVASRDAVSGSGMLSMPPSNIKKRIADAFPSEPLLGGTRQLEYAVDRLSQLDPKTSREVNFAVYTMLSRAVLERIEVEMRASGVFGDPEIGVVADMLVRNFPQLLDNVSKQRVISSLANDNLLSYAAGAQLIIMDALDRIRHGVERLRFLDAVDSNVGSRLNLWFNRFEEIDSQLVDGAPDLREGFALMGEAIDSCERLLAERLGQKRRTMWIGAVGVMLFSLMLGYFVWGTLESIRRSLGALARGTQAFAKGRFDGRVVVNTNDEFRIIAVNINQLADAFVALLKTQQEQAEKSLEILQELVKERTAALTATNAELAATIETLGRTRDELVESEKLAALGGLVAGVAHEVNTPLGLAYTIATHWQDSLASFASKYDAGCAGPEDINKFLVSSAESVRHAVTNLSRAAALIDSFKRIAVDQTNDICRSFDLEGYLDEVVRSLSSILRKGGHRIEIKVDGKIVMESYPGALAQVVTNIVANAVIHGFDGRVGGRILIDCALTDRQCCRIVLSDDGNGMSEAVVKQVFEPFFTTRRGRGGSGLGLNIVYNLVARRLEGSIRCESSEGGGSSFILTLPISVRNPASL